MSKQTELLALQREVLLARSSLCRLKIQRDAIRLRQSVSLRQVGTAIAGSAPTRQLVLGLLLSRLGGRRVSRVVAFASGALAVARIALAALGMLRPAPPATPEPPAQRGD